MLSYAQRDLIADAVVPLLLLWFVLLPTVSLLRGERRQAWRGVLAFVSAVAVVYGWMLLDLRLGLWPHFALDYSTHTAAALALVLLSLAHQRLLYSVGQQGAMAAVLAGVFSAYLALMHFQEYHNLADMLSTVVAVAPLLLLSLFCLYRRA